MANEEYVNKSEFNLLKEEVRDLKKELDDSKNIIQSIDKKVDIIMEKVVNSKETEDLKLTPIKERVVKIEDNQRWLRRTVISELVGIIGGVIIFVIKMMK